MSSVSPDVRHRLSAALVGYLVNVGRIWFMGVSGGVVGACKIVEGIGCIRLTVRHLTFDRGKTVS